MTAEYIANEEMVPAVHAEPQYSRIENQPVRKKSVVNAHVFRRAIVIAGLLIVLVAVLIPIYWAIVLSFDRNATTRLPPFSLWPTIPSLLNYQFAFDTIPLWRLFLNTTIVTLLNTAISVFFALCAGYAFAKGNFRFKNFWFVFMLAVMMIPFESRMIPLFIQYRDWGMLDTWFPLIFGSFAYVFGTFFARQTIAAIPDELREAAYLDGAGEWRIFFQVIIPLCKPLIATLSILQIIHHWNNYLWPLVTIRTQNRQMLSVGVAMFNSQQDAIIFGPRMAVAVISAIPLIILFLFAQKHIIQSVAMTGIK